MDPQPIDPRGSTDGGGSGRRRWWQRKPRGPKAVFLEHRELIATVAARAARRSGFLEQDVEDFVSRVMVRMIEDDYAVIRRHRGDSSLRTFLITVVQNHCRDYRNHKWGKFRPSAIALELGTVAVELELLLVRDQHDLDTAIEILRSRGPRALSRQALYEVAAQLPPRTRRAFVGEEVLEHHTAGAADPAEVVEAGESAETAERLRSALVEALATLDPSDRLLLKLHFRDGETFARIATLMRVEQRAVYTRKDRALRQLKKALVDRGLTWDSVRDILEWRQGALENPLADEDTEGSVAAGGA